MPACAHLCYCYSSSSPHVRSPYQAGHLAQTANDGDHRGANQSFAVQSTTCATPEFDPQ